jgi:hypothetical protein
MIMRYVLMLAFVPAVFAVEPVTFNTQIAPIIYNNCSACHRPDEAAPFSLPSYQDVANTNKGQLVAAVTSSGQMPPWKAEPASFACRDERLSLIGVPHEQSDLKTIRSDFRAHLQAAAVECMKPEPAFALKLRALMAN